LARSDPRDVDILESSIYVCSKSRDEAGPFVNYADPQETEGRVHRLFEGCMRGR
jgi:phosphoenolpyruvate carboxykinase (GTP)